MHSSKLALATLFALVSSAANAVTLDFSGIVFGAYFGNANIAPVAGGACPGTGTLGCYSEDGFILGALADSSNLTAHFHRAGPAADRRISYHSDAAGIYLRKQDGSAFSLSSFDFLAAIKSAASTLPSIPPWIRIPASPARLPTRPLPTASAARSICCPASTT
jgi:hypothetical protein